MDILRLYHPTLIGGGVAKGTQITHLLPGTSPCILCGQDFRRVHSCPVALQLGICVTWIKLPASNRQLHAAVRSVIQTRTVWGTYTDTSANNMDSPSTTGALPGTRTRTVMAACTAAKYSCRAQACGAT